MYPQNLQSIVRQSLLFLTSELYEASIGKLCVFAYPDYFDTTRSIFIHVPKAAGTSVCMALYGQEIGHDTWEKWFLRNPSKFKAYFKFAVIRDPISRFNSAFYFLKKGGMNTLDKEFGATVMKDFDSPNEFAIALNNFHLKRQVLNWWHFRPQAAFVADQHGRSKMDFLIRFEDLDAGFKHVEQRLNCGSRGLPHMNKTKSKPEVHLEKEALEVLNCLYRRDFILWEQRSA